MRSSSCRNAEATSDNHSESASHKEIDAQTEGFHIEIDKHISTVCSPEITHVDTSARLDVRELESRLLTEGGKTEATNI